MRSEHARGPVNVERQARLLATWALPTCPKSAIQLPRAHRTTEDQVLNAAALGRVHRNLPVGRAWRDPRLARIATIMKRYEMELTPPIGPAHAGDSSILRESPAVSADPVIWPQTNFYPNSLVNPYDLNRCPRGQGLTHARVMCLLPPRVNSGKELASNAC
jgi:hypothetical protein